MQTQGDAREHFWRVIKMAKACEVDLAAVLGDNTLNIADYADMITDCRSCTEVAKCDRLLATATQLDAAPDYCRNRDVFAELRHA